MGSRLTYLNSGLQMGKENEREWFLFMNPQKYFSSTVKEGHVVWWKE